MALVNKWTTAAFGAVLALTTPAMAQDRGGSGCCDAPSTPTTQPETREGQDITIAGCHMTADFAERVMSVTADGRTELYTFSSHPHAAGEMSDTFRHTTFEHCRLQSEASAIRNAGRSGVELSNFTP